MNPSAKNLNAILCHSGSFEKQHPFRQLSQNAVCIGRLRGVVARSGAAATTTLKKKQEKKKGIKFCEQKLSVG